ncbi:MAG: hypothetical protein ABI893_04590 [Polaromonas sp.]|uniref:hypothetical protein n=1 Tax=Polaromonas sp. TaxID=1869339 RepID=UPI0032672C71
MPQHQADTVFPIFVAVWVVLGLGSSAFFFLNKDAALKRRVWPGFTVVTGVVFLFFVWLMGAGAEVLLVGVPAVVLITALNLRAVRFCDSCGKTLMNQNPFSPPRFCSKCGAELKR